MPQRLLISVSASLVAALGGCVLAVPPVPPAAVDRAVFDRAASLAISGAS